MKNIMLLLIFISCASYSNPMHLLGFDSGEIFITFLILLMIIIVIYRSCSYIFRNVDSSGFDDDSYGPGSIKSEKTGSGSLSEEEDTAGIKAESDSTSNINTGSDGTNG